MIIIGEKINGAIPKTAEAIRSRDEAYIQNLVRIQESSGADYLDVCAGTSPEKEYDALCWLIDTVQSVASRPLCIDSPNPKILESVLPRVRQPGIINSISGEGDKCAVLLPLLNEHPEWHVVALCCDSGGIPAKAEEKERIALKLIDAAESNGVSPERIYIDPLVLALSAVNDAALEFCKAAGSIKAACHSVKIAAALSNVSFGMPVRSLVNKNFLTMAMTAGLDAVIMDPTNRELAGTIYAVDALLGRDRLCRKYNNAYRAGKIGPERL